MTLLKKLITPWLNNENKPYNYIAIGMVIFYMTYPLRRIIFVWPEADFTTYSYAFDNHRLALLFFLILLFAVETNQPIGTGWKKTVSSKVFNPVVISAMTAFLVLALLGKPGAWWSWISIANISAMFLLITNWMKKSIGPGESAMVALGCILLVIGSWEVMYQWTKYFWYYADVFPTSNLMYELVIEIPYIGIGSAILGYYLLKYRKRYRLNAIVFMFPLLTLFCFTEWIRMGFWIDIYYAPETTEWIYSPATASGLFQLQLSKSSKTFMMLSYLTLLRGGIDKELWLNTSLSRSQVCPGTE